MKDTMVMLLFVLILGTVLTVSLVLVDSYTKPIIEKNETVKLKLNILKALDIPFTKENVEEIFGKSIKQAEKKGQVYYTSETGNIAVLYSGSGLWGPISGVLAMQPDLQTIHGITVLYQEETPGLGSRIADKPFLDTFKAKRFIPALKLTAAGKGSQENEIDGISGATLSSNAFIKILNSRYTEFYSKVKGE
ncbi:MAG: FMN-binding protein [Spirochaetota bacterium]